MASANQATSYNSENNIISLKVAIIEVPSITISSIVLGVLANEARQKY